MVLPCVRNHYTSWCLYTWAVPGRCQTNYRGLGPRASHLLFFFDLRSNSVPVLRPENCARTHTMRGRVPGAGHSFFLFRPSIEISRSDRRSLREQKTRSRFLLASLELPPKSCTGAAEQQDEIKACGLVLYWRQQE